MIGGMRLGSFLLEVVRGPGHRLDEWTDVLIKERLRMYFTATAISECRHKMYERKQLENCTISILENLLHITRRHRIYYVLSGTVNTTSPLIFTFPNIYILTASDRTFFIFPDLEKTHTRLYTPTPFVSLPNTMYKR